MLGSQAQSAPYSDGLPSIASEQTDAHPAPGHATPAEVPPPLAAARAVTARSAFRSPRPPPLQRVPLTAASAVTARSAHRGLRRHSAFRARSVLPALLPPLLPASQSEWKRISTSPYTRAAAALL